MGIEIDRTNFTGHHILFGCLFLAGAVFFLWFCWPAVFKGMINAGNVCGMLASAVMMYYGIRYQKVHQLLAFLWQKKPMRVVFILLTVLVLAGIILVIAACAAIMGASSKNIPDNTPAVVLGCAVKGSYPSRVLQERIDAAYAYLQEYPQTVCILSGGQGKGEDISEAECMYQELVWMGIDADRLYQEAESVNTRENLENSEKILIDLENSEKTQYGQENSEKILPSQENSEKILPGQENSEKILPGQENSEKILPGQENSEKILPDQENSEKIPCDLENQKAVTVISSEFHLYRGRWWAGRLGFRNYGYAAHTDWKYLPTLLLREVIAVVHLWLTDGLR